jgi:hypothetical protein
MFSSPVDMSSLDILSDGRSSLPASPTTTDASYQGIDISVNQTLGGLTESPQLVYSDPSALPTDAMYTKSFVNGQTNDSPLVYTGGPQEIYSNYSSHYPSVYPNDLANQLSVFENLPSNVDPLIGLGWDAATSPLDTKAYNNGFKLPSQNDLAVSTFAL